MKPRLGFLGTGSIGRHRMEIIAQSGEAEVAYIYDPSISVLQQAWKIAPNARIANSFEEILDSDVDGIVIATPTAQHAEQSIRALLNKKAVFCQKPLGRTAVEAKRVIDVARNNDRLLGADFAYRYTEAMQTIYGLIKTGDVGDVFSINIAHHGVRSPDKEWCYDKAISGGGCVMDLGSHLVDLALWSTDFASVQNVTSRLFARGRPLMNRDDVEDYAIARLDLANGISVDMSCSWCGSPGAESVISATFQGSKGALALKNLNGSLYDFSVERYRGKAKELLLSPPDPWGGRAAINWAKQLSRDHRYNPEADSLVSVARALDMIYGRT